MRNHSEQLDNDALLLMYLADELSVEQRAAVEQRLGADVTLQERLEALRVANEQAALAIARLDDDQIISASQAASVRQIGRAIDRWSAERASAAIRRAYRPPREMRVPWWAYPLAAAAIVTLAFSAWWRTLPEPEHPSRGDPLVVAPPGIIPPSVDDPLNVVTDPASADAGQFAFLDSLDEMPSISKIERQHSALELFRESLQ